MKISTPWLKKIAYTALSVYAVLLFFYSGYYFFKNQLYLSNTDSFFYYSIAENLQHSGKLQSTILQKPEKVVTPQIGVALIMTAFLGMGFERDGVFAAISALYFLLYAASVYPLYRLGKLAGLSSFAGAALIIAFLSNTFNLHDTMQVLNEGAFNFLALLVLLIAAQLLEMGKDHHALSTLRARYFRNGVLLIICSSAMIVFRVQGLLIVLAVLLAALYLAAKKRSPGVALSAGVFFCSTLVSFYAVNRLLGVQNHVFFSQASVTYAFKFERLLQKAVLCAQDYLFFSAALVLLVRSLFKPDKIVRLFLSIVCVFTIVFSFSLDYSLLIMSRYFAYIWPVTFLFILLESRLRYAGYALIVLTMLQSTLTCRRVHEFYCYEPLYLYMHSKGTSLPAHSVLASYPAYDRISWYFLRTPVWHSVEQCIDAVKTAKPLFIIGPREYLSKQLTIAKSIASEKHHELIVDTISAGFVNGAGDALLRLRVQGRDSVACLDAHD